MEKEVERKEMESVGCDETEDEDSLEESDADHRARLMQVDTFLRLNESISSLQEIGKKKPEYAFEVQKMLQSSSFDRDGTDGEYSPRVADSSGRSADTTKSAVVSEGGKKSVQLKTHAHVIYHGDLLQYSKETVTMVVSERDMTLFARIIECFKRMVMGTHTDEDVGRMRRDYDALIEMWDETTANGGGGGELNIGGELNGMMRSMLDTPLYYSNSCMAMIACGKMLRNLYTATEGGHCESYERLMCFVRRNMRHNPVDPFDCDCGEGGCSRECKTLMSMIMEMPTVVHNQAYVLQILAYLMYDKAGREEVFINNLKNTCSPGLLDKIPTRVSLLMGSLDEIEIAHRYRVLRKKMQHLNPVRGTRAACNNHTLERLVQTAQNPQVRTVVELLPGAAVAAVELRLPKCATGKRQCLNKDYDAKTILSPESNNNGKNKCCGYLRLDPFDILVSSISLTQLLVYLFTDPRKGSPKSRRHFFVRDIITTMAKQSVKIKVETLEEIFCYLDRTNVFKSFNDHPFMMSALHELFTTYIESMKEAAEKYKESGKRRRIKRYLKKNGLPHDEAVCDWNTGVGK